MKIAEALNLRRILRRLTSSRDIYVAAGAGMISALVLIVLQKIMLTDAEFVTVSIVFASTSVIAVIAQMGDDSDVLEGLGAPLWRGAVAITIARILSIAIILSIPFYMFNEAVDGFGSINFVLFVSTFSIANWSYNLRRNQALMLSNDTDFRNVSLLCAAVRLGGFVILAPLLGQYALVSEVIARILMVPATSSLNSDSLVLTPLSARKLVRSLSYSTDALVQSQTLTAISIVSTASTAATIILLARVIFYGTGGLSQVVGAIFNREIFNRRNIPFIPYLAPGMIFALILMAGLWLYHLFGWLAPTAVREVFGITLALFAFPILHPLSRLFTATNRESIKLILQLSYCGTVVLASAYSETLWSTIAVAGIFSILYSGIFIYLIRVYRSYCGGRGAAAAVNNP